MARTTLSAAVLITWLYYSQFTDHGMSPDVFVVMSFVAMAFAVILGMDVIFPPKKKKRTKAQTTGYLICPKCGRRYENISDGDKIDCPCGKKINAVL